MAKSLLPADDGRPALLNLAGYAAHRKANGLSGQSHVAVWKAISTGRIAEPAVCRDGNRWLIDPATADQQWAANTRSTQPSPATALPAPASEIARPTWNQEIIDAKLRKVQSIAEREELVLKRQKGELLHVRDVRKRWHENAMSLRDAFLEIPAALSQELANESDPKGIERTLTTKIVSILQELANA